MSELVLVANAGDGTISTLRVHTDREPRLESVATAPVGTGCGTFVIDSERDLVYAAYKGDPPGIITMRLDRETGYLTPVSRRPVKSSLAYLSLAAEGTLLLGASYGGGFGAVWRLEPDGPDVIGGQVEFGNVHCAIASGDIAYFVSLGQDLIAQYRLGPDGSLNPLDPETVAAPEGSGPRHLVVDGGNAYLITEFSGEAIRFDVGADGSLTRAEAVSVVDPSAGLAHSRLGADPEAEKLIWGADLHLAGPRLLCSERSASTIATVSLTPEGHLGEVVSFAPTEEQPRGFAVSPDGRFVVAVGEKSRDVALSRVEDDGTLTLLSTQKIGDGANWVRFVE